MRNLQEHTYGASNESRYALNGHLPALVWFTGLSGSGKSTLADALEKALIARGVRAYHLDGDSMRLGLNSDLGFSQADRDENIRRVGEVAALMLDAGLVVIAAFISPMRYQREALRTKVGANRFMEVHVNTPIEVCEARDIKGLYAKARKGEIDSFTGISAPYEEPVQAELTIDTSVVSMDAALALLIEALRKKGITTMQ